MVYSNSFAKSICFCLHDFKDLVASQFGCILIIHSLRCICLPQIMLLETSRRYNPSIDSITFLKDFSYNKEDFAKAGEFAHFSLSNVLEYIILGVSETDCLYSIPFICCLKMHEQTYPRSASYYAIYMEKETFVALTCLFPIIGPHAKKTLKAAVSYCTAPHFLLESNFLFPCSFLLSHLPQGFRLSSLTQSLSSQKE